MWTLVLIYAMQGGGYNGNTPAAAFDHIDGFASEQACVKAAAKIQRVNSKIPSSIHTFCVKKE